MPKGPEHTDPRGVERFLRDTWREWLLVTLVIITVAAPSATRRLLSQAWTFARSYAQAVLWVLAAVVASWATWRFGSVLLRRISTWQAERQGRDVPPPPKEMRASGDSEAPSGPRPPRTEESLGGGKGFFARHRYTALLLVLAPLASGAVWYTFTQDGTLAMGLSGHAAGLASIVTLVLAFVLWDKLPFHRVDTFGEIERGNLAVAGFSAAIILAFALVIFGATSMVTTTVQTTAPAQSRRAPTATDTSRAGSAGAQARARRSAHVDTALTYVGTLERGENRGARVEKFLASVGLGGGYPWCAAFASYCMEAAGASGPPHDARSRMLVTAGSLTQQQVRSALTRGREILSRGMLTIHRYTRYRGHTGILVSQDGRAIRTVEGNVGGPRGEGVWRKERPIVGSAYLAPAVFTPVTYPPSKKISP